MEKDSKIKDLEIFLIDNKELEKLEDIADRFNIFTALGIVNNELKHSNFLAWLMSPNENHEIEDYFLKIFLKKVVSKIDDEKINIFKIDSWDLYDSEIKREWNNIDILIKCENQNFTCVIENKIHSGEGEGQLIKYRRYIESEFKNYKNLFVYLTVEDQKPSDESYISLNYSEVILLLEQLLSRKADKLNPKIVDFISDYIEILRRYQVENSEIQKICEHIYEKHKNAIDLIIEYKPDTQLKIKDTLIELINQDESLENDHSSKSVIRFIPKSIDYIPRVGNWTETKRIVLFEVRNYKDRVDLFLVIGPGSQEIREKIYQLFLKDSVFSPKVPKTLYPQYCGIKILSLLSQDTLNNIESNDLALKLSEGLKKFKQDYLPKIEKTLKDIKDNF